VDILDKIILPKMEFQTCHGLLPEEKTTSQKFLVRVEMELDLTGAALSDDINETLDYRLIYQCVAGIMNGRPVNLLETLAIRIINELLGLDNRIAAVNVYIEKANALLAEGVSLPAAVSIYRTRTGRNN